MNKQTIDRLRRIAETPERTAMNRNTTWPTTHGRVQQVELELERVRAALREALAIIDTLNTK
jgi:hypothetical protein